MPVHLRGAFEQFLERVPAQSERGGDADRAPQRIAPADALAELEDSGFVDPGVQRRFRHRGDCDQPSVRIGDPGGAQPVERRVHVCQGLERRERLRHGDDQRRRGIEPAHGFLERRSVDVGDKAHVEPGPTPAERVHEQRRPEQRSADADVQHARHRSERAGLDRVDEGAHSLAAGGREIHVLRRAAAALGDVRRGAALARIDDSPGKERVSLRREARRLGAGKEPLEDRPVQVSLRPVEIEPGDLEAELRQPIRLGREQLVQPLHLKLPLFARHCREGHNGRTGKS